LHIIKYCSPHFTGYYISIYTTHAARGRRTYLCAAGQLQVEFNCEFASFHNALGLSVAWVVEKHIAYETHPKNCLELRDSFEHYNAHRTMCLPIVQSTHQTSSVYLPMCLEIGIWEKGNQMVHCQGSCNGMLARRPS